MTVRQNKTTRHILTQKILFRAGVLAALAFSAWVLHFFVRLLLLGLAQLIQ